MISSTTASAAAISAAVGSPTSASSSARYWSISRSRSSRRSFRAHGRLEQLRGNLDEAEQLADRIAILHEGRIIVDGTLAELKRLLPPVTVEYVEKQPTLEEVFLAVIGPDRAEGAR